MCSHSFSEIFLVVISYTIIVVINHRCFTATSYFLLDQCYQVGRSIYCRGAKVKELKVALYKCKFTKCFENECAPEDSTFIDNKLFFMCSFGEYLYHQYLTYICPDSASNRLNMKCLFGFFNLSVFFCVCLVSELHLIVFQVDAGTR